MKHLRNRRGIGLTEAVIAMVIIVTVSVAAVGLLTRFATISADSFHKAEAINLVNNALESFKFSNSQNEFDFNMTNWLNVTDWARTDRVQYTYTGISGYVVTMNVSYGFGSHLARFTASVRREGKTALVYSIVGYTKYVP